MTAVVPFDQLPSRTPTAPRRTSQRVDPFHDERLLRPGAGIEWWSRRDAARAVKQGAMTGLARQFRVRPSEARARIERNLATAQHLVGAVAQWRTMSAEQAEAMTDVRGVDLGAKRPWATTLWAADLLDIATAGGSFNADSSAQRLLRLANRHESTLDWLESISTYTEFVAMNSGHELRQDRNSPRHNVLAVELALRVSEFCSSVELVLGEGVSSYASLLDVETKKFADMTLVRRDGLRVAVEMTASSGRLQEKVREVAAVVRRSSRRDCIVLFVAAGKGGTHRGLQRAIAAEAPDLHDRIALVAAREWFPSEHVAAHNFASLPVAFYRGGAWVRESLDSVPLVTRDPHLTDVFKNARGLHGVPHWLRAGERFDLATWLVDRAFPSGVPVPEGAQTAVAKPLTRLVY